MEGFLTFQFEGLSEQGSDAAVAVAVAVGTLYCFLGYRTLKFVIGLTGFLLAGGAAGALAGWLSDANLVVMAIAAGVGGIAGAFAFFFLYKVGVFTIGLLAGCMFTHNALVGQDLAWAPFVTIGVGIAAGLIALVLERPVMMVGTAVIGSWVLVSGFAHFIRGTEFFQTDDGAFDADRARLTLLVAWLVLGVLGVYTQFVTRKRQKN